MRVLILAQHISRVLGGIEIQCDLLAREFSELGHEVHYGAVDSRQVLSPPENPYAIHAWPVGNAAGTRALFAQIRPDVIYLRHNKIALRTTARAAAQVGIPLVFAASSLQDVQAWSYHRKHVPWSPRRLASVAWQRIKSRWNWTGFRYVAGAISLNADYTPQLPVAPRLHIPDAMETTCVPFSWPRPYLVWVAQIKDYKNPGEFVELARRCADLDMDFLLIGHVVSERYRWIAQPEHTPSHFHYLGGRTPEEVNGVLAGAYALIHTCDPEGFGNNFIQAWQQGIPSLSLRFDPGGIIEREALGSVPGSLDGLERDLRALVADPYTRAAVGSRAAAYALRHHDARTNATRVAAFLTEVVQERART